jgi:hypothetical protein
LRESPVTTTSEKYGTEPASTSLTGSHRPSGIDARSTYSAWSSRPAASSARRTAGNVRPSFITIAASVSASRRASSGSGSVPGSTVSTSVCRTNGLAAAAVAAAKAGTPGTISVG